MTRSLSAPEPLGCPPQPPHGWAGLVRRLRRHPRRRLMRDLQRRAEWAGQARQAPTLRDWMDDIDRAAP